MKTKTRNVKGSGSGIASRIMEAVTDNMLVRKYRAHKEKRAEEERRFNEYVDKCRELEARTQRLYGSVEHEEWPFSRSHSRLGGHYFKMYIPAEFYRLVEQEFPDNPTFFNSEEEVLKVMNPIIEKIVSEHPNLEAVKEFSDFDTVFAYLTARRIVIEKWSQALAPSTFVYLRGRNIYGTH